LFAARGTRLSKKRTEEAGFVAIEEAIYEIKGARLFREASYARKIIAKGELIIIYDPKVDYAPSPYWENGDDFPRKQLLLCLLCLL